jgi:dipeptidyl aminopeptidase/acylaminoacyl peptidase
MLFAMTPPAHVATLTLADLRKTVTLTSPQISPDGRSILVQVKHNDYDKDKTVTDLVIVDVATHRSRTLLHDAAGLSSVEWSPDGTRLAYVAGRQAYVLPMNGGEPLQITHVKTSVDALDWRPDGGAIAYAAQIEPANHARIEHHEDEFNVNDDAWTDQEAPELAQLYEVSSSGGAGRRIGRGDWSVGGGFTYARDGRSIFVTRISGDRSPNRYLSREIVRVDVASGKSVLLHELSLMQTDPLRGPHGEIAYAFANPAGTMQIEVALASADGGNPHMVTQRLDRNVNGAAFLPNGSLIVTANDATGRRIFRITPGGAVSALPLGTLVPAFDASASRTGSVAFVAAAPDRPAELFVLPAGAKAPIRLTNQNRWIEHYALGESHSITWRTKDGLIADGVVTTPPGWHHGQRAPLVLYIHGGPTSSSTTGYSGFVQVLAAHGWMVFQPNYRGSDNLGLRFARTTVPHISSVPGDDIETGLAQVMREYPVDARRIAVSGWSEGGLMTSWLITHDTRWRAAVSGAAVNDWVQYDTMTDSKDFTPQFIGKSPWSSSAEFAFYEDESPLTYASRVRTPTLILSDAGDYRVPTPLAYEFYHEVRATGTPVQFVIYPVIGHFPRDPVRAEDVNRRWERWLVQHMR